MGTLLCFLNNCYTLDASIDAVATGASASAGLISDEIIDSSNSRAFFKPIVKGFTKKIAKFFESIGIGEVKDESKKVINQNNETQKP